MTIYEPYDTKSGKRMAKRLKKMGIKLEKSLDYQNALIIYEEAKKIANKWNLDKILALLSVRISQVLIENLKNDLKGHLDAIAHSEARREYIKVYEHIKEALMIANKLKSNDFNETNLLIDQLEEKFKYWDNHCSKIIITRFYNGNLYETPILLKKALEMIDGFPNSFEIPKNYISFENGINQKVFFKHISRNLWYMRLPLIDKFSNTYKLKLKNISTNMVKIIILNFFRGYFIGDFISKSDNINHQQNNLLSIIRKFKDQLTQFTECQFCNNPILKIGQNNCEYCGIEINYEDLLLPQFSINQ